MRRLINISVYAMSAICAGILTACGSVSDIPLDDAYIWNDNTQSKTVVPVSEAEPASSTVYAEPSEPTPMTPTLEFTNVQDTTITVKITR